MEFRIAPMTVESAKRFRDARVALPRNLSPGQALSRRELAQLLGSVEGFRAKSSPGTPVAGKLWRIDLRPQSRKRIDPLFGEYATIIISPCPKVDEIVEPVVVQDGSPIAAVTLAFALTTTTGPLVLDGGEFYGSHPIWEGRDFASVLRDIAVALEEAIAEEEYTNQDELCEQLERLHAIGGRSKGSSSKRSKTSPAGKRSEAQNTEPNSLESPQWRAILSEVLRDPSDDAPRLAAADWLAENGHQDRAELIRAQIEYERMVIPGRCQKAVKQFRASCGAVECQPCNASLLARNRKDSLGVRSKRLLDVASNQREWCGFKLPGRSWRIGFARGFVDVVMLQVADFLSHAAAIFRAEPITHVGLTYVSPGKVIVQREGSRAGVGEVWLRDTNTPVTRRTQHSNRMPALLFDRLPGAEGQNQLEFAEGVAALALERVCVAYGREMAGLPPWEPPLVNA